MEYIDSSVFIGAFLPTDPNHNEIKKTEKLLYTLRFLIFLWLINRERGGKSQTRISNFEITYSASKVR